MPLDMNGIIYVTPQQTSPVLGSEGVARAGAGSRLGQLYTADWKHHIVGSGYGFCLSMGQITAGGDIGGFPGVGTALNLDQPTAFITVDVGYALIPFDLELDFQSDVDGYDDIQRILLTADVTQAIAAGGTFVEAEANLATANGCAIRNLISDGRAFPGRAATAITVDIVDPVHNYILAHSLYELTQVAAEVAGNAPGHFLYQKQWHYPIVLKGPCSMQLYVEGLNPTTGLGALSFGCVPSTWFPVT